MKIGLYVIKQVINQIKMDSLCLLFNQAGGVRKGEGRGDKNRERRQNNRPVFTCAKSKESHCFRC